MSCFLIKQPPVVMLGKFGDLISILPALQSISKATGEKVKVIVSSQYQTVLEGVSYVESLPMDFEWPLGTKQAREYATKEYGSCLVPQFWADPTIRDGIPYGQTSLEIGGSRWSIDSGRWPNYMSAMWQRLGFTDQDMQQSPVVFDRRNPERERLLKERYIHANLPTLLVNFKSSSSPFGYEPEIMKIIPKGQFSIVDVSEIKAERIYDLLGLFESAVGLITCATATLHLAAASKIPYIAFTEDHWSRAVPKGNCRLNVSYSKTPAALVDIAKIMRQWSSPVVAKKLSAFDEANAPSILEQTAWDRGYFDFSNTNAHPRPGTDYFNCGLVARPDGDWLIVRRSIWRPNMAFGMNSLITFRLDGVIPTEAIPINFPNVKPEEHFEDPRVFQYQEKTFVSANNFVWGREFPKAHQILSVVDDKWKVKNTWHPIVGHNGYAHGTNTGSEKNWLWFFHDDNLHLIYMTHPHTIVRFDEKFRISQVYETQCPDLQWPWGGPRGGTPPILVDGLYWTFFHSSVDWCEHGTRRYHMGAYAFESKPPFKIVRFVKKPILNGSIKDTWAQGKPLVVFPCGSIYRNGEWLVSMGINDLICAWIKIPHEDLIKLTIPIDRVIDLRLTHVQC